MKKLLVSDSNIDTEVTNEISLQLSSHHAYGLYNFDPERMVEDVCRKFNLTLSTISHPKFILEDANGRELTLLISEENYGY